MLPSAKQSLMLGGLSSRAAAWTLILCFIAGVVGIQIISRILHHYIPHHVVDCDHSHEEDEEHAIVHSRQPSRSAHHHDHETEHHHGHSHPNSEMTMRDSASTLAPNSTQSSSHSNGGLDRRQSLPYQLGNKVSELVSLQKPQCDTHGQCYGFSEPCGFECFKIISKRGGSRQASYSSTTESGGGSLRHPGLKRSATTSRVVPRVGEQTPLLQDIREDATLSPPKTASPVISANGFSRPSSYTSLPPPGDASTEGDECEQFDEGEEEDEHGHDHHHHVPNNAFLSIGLQTSIAIAVHKLPEGFITYATNHANPRLGFSVFMALFIHNITEGFAMALPLYLAINSRAKAMFWSSLLGGVSQPLGAGIAALWFKLAGVRDSEPGEGVYGGMFAVTGKSS